MGGFPVAGGGGSRVVIAAGVLGASYTPNLNNQQDTLIYATLGANLTVNAPVNVRAGSSLTFDITQDAVTPRTVTWFAASQPAGSIAAVDPTPGSRTVVSLYTPDGATWVGWSTRLGVIDLLRNKRYHGESAGAITATLQSAVSGTGASVAADASSQAPNDARGNYDVTCRSTPAPAAGDVLAVTYTAGYAAVDASAKAPAVMVTPRSTAAVAAGLYVATLADHFTLKCRNAPAASDVLSFSYWVVG